MNGKVKYIIITILILVVAAVSGCGSSVSEEPPVAIEGTIVFASPPHKGDLFAPKSTCSMPGGRTS